MSSLVSESISSSDKIIESLVRDRDRVHAVLLYGAEGVDLGAVADRLTQAWICSTPLETGGCGECASCKAFQNGRLVDVMRVKPWGPSHWIKQGAITPSKPNPIDPDEPKPSLIEFLRTSPLMSKRKVAIFEQADRMNTSAANAFLKTLEEPPAYAKLMLTTTEFSKLLPTIRSRCMAVCCSLGHFETSTEMEECWCSSPTQSQQIDQAREQYEALWNLFESSLTAPMGAAIAFAERCRESAEPLSKALKVNMRSAQAEQLRCLAAWLLLRRSDRPELIQTVVEAHRLIRGNLNAGALYDHVWIEILSR